MSRKVLGKIYRGAGASLEQYARRLKLEVPIFSDSYNNGMKAISGLINLSGDLQHDNNKDQLLIANKSLAQIVESLSSSQPELLSFRDTISNLPRIEKHFNRTRAEVVNQLDFLVRKLMKPCY